MSFIESTDGKKGFIDMMISSVDKSYSERLQEYRKLKEKD